MGTILHNVVRVKVKRSHDIIHNDVIRFSLAVIFADILNKFKISIILSSSQTVYFNKISDSMDIFYNAKVIVFFFRKLVFMKIFIP